MMRLGIIAAVVVTLGLAGCASSPEADLANLPKPKTPEEAVNNVIALSAGYCKGMAERHGEDFATCFKQLTDFVIVKLQENGESQ